MVYKDLTFEEFEKNFKSVKHNKAVKHDDMDRNGIIKVYDEISYPLEQLKVAKVSTVFKIGNIEQIGKYRPISVFPIFSKVLETIMYNRTSQYFKENKIFFPKQFGFQVNNSTHHAILNPDII